MNTTGTDELVERLALSLTPGIGPHLQTLLLEHFGSPANVLRQPRERLLQVRGIGSRIVDELLSPGRYAEAEDLLHQCEDSGIELVPQDADKYPERLAEIPDAPALLYLRGTLLPRDALAVAIVGARRCTSYGRRQAEKLAGGLARAGLTIVSGLARGIDAAAHRGAMDAGGRTLAILATGVGEIYPPEHADLAMQIAEQGALISEFSPGQSARPGLFPQRNRIISGMSLAVVVVEATRSSGALYTARHAQEQDRDVMAVPGQVDSIVSDGCHELLRDGATLIRHADDVLDHLGPLAGPVAADPHTEVRNPRELTLNKLETEILNLVSTSPVHLDEILRSTQLPTSQVMSTLTVLEMKRFVRRLPGNQFLRPD